MCYNKFSVFILLLLFYVCFEISDCDITVPFNMYDTHPKILSSNGNLRIVAAWSKNISFETYGEGFININGQNLVKIAKLAYNASKTVLRIRNGIVKDLDSNVRYLHQSIEEPTTGLRARVIALERGINSTGYLYNDSPPQIFNNRQSRTISNLRRQITRVEAKVNRISNLLIRNECLDDPCKNGATCLDIFNGFICQCPNNWEGPVCDKDVNECARFAGTDLGCQNGATCINYPGSYNCTCPNGYFGLHCKSKTSSCSSGTQNELCGRGICVDRKDPSRTGYTCICDQGWTTDGRDPACTVDVDECSSKQLPCSTNPPVSCHNVPGSFFCGPCPQGYTGNGYYCSDIDECLLNNGGCSVLPKVQCINTPGSRICGLCPPGYVGDGVTCAYQGLCQVNNGGCHPLAQCFENPSIGNNFVRCICPTGYIGSGVGPSGCIASLNPVGPAVSGACSGNPCKHGTCIDSGNGQFTCICQTGFSGPLCDLLDNCAPNPCMNNGKCVSKPDGFECICTNDYTGDRCENEKQNCGGRLRETSGSLDFPPVNGSYQKDVNCAWVIESPDEQKVLKITFTKFHIEDSADCSFDWLQIHDGKNSAAHKIGRFCGTTLPNGGTITSTHDIIYLWFRSDHSVSEEGFSLTWESVEPACGGILPTMSHGTISSPGSPGNYPSNRDCFWVVLAPLGKRIQFHFFTLMIGNNPNCSFDFLKIHSGERMEDSIIGEYCNTSHPEPLLTPGPEAVVHFHSDGSDNYPGFQLAYSVVEGIPGCGGIYTSETAEISSPTQNGEYINNLVCEYKIKLPRKSRIKLTFINFELEDSPHCIFDRLEIFEGSSSLVGRYCGTNLPPSYTSIGNEVLLKFETDWTTTRGGFRLKYELVCGGIYTDPEGVIQSPGYPDEYADNRRCIYEIRQPVGTNIVLNFLDFETEDSSYSCDFDFLQIRDGDSENATEIGRYCGTLADVPASVVSSYNHLYLYFETDGSVAAKGFYANYTTNAIGCGGIMKERNGVIESPDHPDSYPPNKMCKWKILAPGGFIIKLTWVSFNLEKSRNCTYDYVKVTDHSSTSAMGGVIGIYCGTSLPPMLVSSENQLSIEFMSDGSKAAEGFMATYIMLDESKVCGREYFTTNGIIRSPGYPDRYPHNQNCVWIINVPTGQQIMLNFTDFEIERHRGCRFDYLEIRNGGYESSPLIGKFCGTMEDVKSIQSLPSLTNQLYLRFVSDRSRSAKGFMITWDGTTTGCGGTLSSFTGHVTSPNYPKPYGNNAECFWKISVNAGSVIEVIILDIDLEPHGSCRFDYIEMVDGITYDSKAIGKYCNENHPSIIKSTSNHMIVKFRSDTTFQGRGFNLKYNTMCNTIQKGYRGVIESPNFPNNYPPNIECTWVISVPRGNKVNITFSHFALEDYTNTNVKCNYDYVEIKEGDDPEVPTQDGPKLCGETLPTPYSSTLNNVFVMFKTDPLLALSGFRMEWTIDGCGGLMTHPRGTLMTPGYPKAYPASTVCEWKIQIDYGHSVQFTVNDLNLEKMTECRFDSLKIYGGPDDTAPLLSTLCDKSKDKMTVTSSGNTMFVRFTSDPSFNGKGFIGDYKSVPSNCGGLFTAPTGTIHSKNYPLNYDSNDDCGWLIKMPETYSVRLTLIDVDIEAHRNCTADYVEVHDGPDLDAPILLRHCGSSLPNVSTLHSSGNSMYIRMKSDGYFAAKGFRADYSINCGSKIITNSTGIINLHEHTGMLENCSWTIMAQNPEQHVSLTITHMDIDACYFGLESEYAPVAIYDGDDSDAPVLGTFCDSKIPPTIVSRGSSLHIVLRQMGTAFIATYSTLSSACGGLLTSSEGSFASIGYPDNYPMGAQCNWIIRPSPGNKVLLKFSSFDLEDSENCNTDFVEIHENNAVGRLLGVFCGSNIPNNITVANSLWIQFKTDQFGTAKGFLAEYFLVHGNEITGNEGEIASPLYPLQFSRYGEYTWRIIVPFGGIVSIKFEDFAIESYNTDCYFYGLEIFDGYDETAPSLVNLCGFDLPEPIRSTSNVVFLKFVNQESGSGSLFYLKWQAVDKNIRIAIPSKNEVEGCGNSSVIDLVQLKNYTLTSPGYPNGYAGQLNCEWMFSTADGNHLSVLFYAVDLETSENCLMDAVNIFQGKQGTNDWEKLYSICYTNTSTYAPYHSYSNLMKVQFKSDMYINKTGFKAVIAQECGGSLTASNGIIEMSNATIKELRLGFRMKYKECQWNVTVKPGRTIAIEFDEFSIGSTADPNGCSDNYISLKNGGSADSPWLGDGKYCGSETPNIPETSSHQLYIKYVFTSETQKFKLKYREVALACGGNVKLSRNDNSSIISSPRYPNSPPPHSECIWIVEVPGGESISVEFLDRFDIMKTSNCTTAYVELRDGATVNSALIGQPLCGSDLPSSQRTTGNILYLRFFSDVSEPKNGFKAKVSIATCGGTIRDRKGTVSYPNNAVINVGSRVGCSWKIVGPIDHNLKFNFNNIRLPKFSNCESVDHITFKEINPTDDTETILGTFCGQTNPNVTIFSAGNEVFIELKLVSNTRNVKIGFSISYDTQQEACGGTLEGSEGFFTSPGYPVAKHYRRTCEWKIIVPEGRRVTVELLDFDLEENAHYTDQGISFYNGPTYRARITYLHGGSNVRTVKSSTNYMRIYFWSGIATGHRGFRAKYTSNEPTICEGDLNGEEGLIRPPSENTSFYCEWKRNFRPVNSSVQNQTLELKFSDVIAGKRGVSFCVHSFGSIFIRAESKKLLIYDFCGGVLTKPVVVRSPYLDTSIEAIRGLVSDMYNFTLNYKIHPCGGIVTQSGTSITSPGYPVSLGLAFECAWIISAPAGQIIKATFTDINLSTNCEDEFVEIKNGPNPKSPTIGKYCGNLLRDPFKSQSNKMWIDFHAINDSIPNESEMKKSKGFKMDIEFEALGCGGVLHDDVDTFTSPNFPQDYPNNVECIWELRAKSGYHIGLEFTDAFQLEDSTDCQNDYVEIIDYLEENHAVNLGRVCGKSIPKVYNSTSNKMVVVFRTNRQTTGNGFKVKWHLNCGGTFVASMTPKYIVSPGYPGLYGKGLNCTYVIKAPGKYINLEFEDFMLEEGHVDCRFDNVTVFSRRQKIGTYCSTNKPPSVRLSDVITVAFKTDKWVQKNGFKFKYQLDYCGGTINSSGSVITSPSQFGTRPESNKYYGSLNCYWFINAPTNQVISLSFKNFDLEYNSQCVYDYVSIHDGGNVTSLNRLALLCGNLNDSLPVLRSTQNKMAIKLHTDQTNHFSGFEAFVLFTYGESEGCGGTIKLNTTERALITSPDIDRSGIYVPYLDCHWLISAPIGNIIKVSFSAMHVSPCQRPTVPYEEPVDCTCDYVEAYDGTGTFSEQMLHVCGHTLPTDLVTSGNNLFLRFKTSASTIRSTGFKAYVQLVQSICGPQLLTATSTPQYLTSPNYPNTYPPNTRCFWKISSSDTKGRIDIHFEDMELEKADSSGMCTDDKLEISDSSVLNIITEGLGQDLVYSGQRTLRAYIPMHGYGSREPITKMVFCGTGQPTDFYSGSDEVALTFISKSNVHKGFKIKYSIAGCSRNYTGIQGRILSKDAFEECFVTITVPENRTIALYFNSLFIFDASGCTSAGLAIREGVTNTGSAVTVCGMSIPNPYFSHTNVVSLHVWKKNRIMMGHYDITYTSTTEGRGCGGVIFNYVGVFTSPMYPSNYRNASDCRWDVSTPHNTGIALKFTTFDIGTKKTCESDYVQLIDIDATIGLETVRVTYCGEDSPGVFLSSSNLMAVRYVTSVNNAGTGWVASFVAKPPGTTITNYN